MKQGEWLEQFRQTYGRYPSQEEFNAAYQRGEFLAETPQNTQTPPSGHQPQTTYQGQPPAAAPKRKMRPGTIVLISILSVVGGLLLLCGIGLGLYYQSGNIDGVWETTSYRYYDEDKEKWYSSESENNKYTHYFAEVKNGHYKEYFYYDNPSDESYSYISPINYFDAFMGVNQWKRSLEPTLTTEGFKKELEEVITEHYDGSQYTSSSSSFKKSYLDFYEDVKSRKQTYVRQGNRLTVKIYNSDGKFIMEMTFKKLNASQTKALYRKYNKIKESYESQYGDKNDY